MPKQTEEKPEAGLGNSTLYPLLSRTKHKFIGGSVSSKWTEVIGADFNMAVGQEG